MNTSKIIKGAVSNGRYTVTAPIVKEDYGIYLKIEGVELPSTYEVDFSNSENNGTSVTMIGNADGVLIPSQFISSGKDVFAFLYHVGADYGRTVYKFRIPNKVRPDRTDDTPTPEEQSVIDQAISALNTAVAKTAQDVIDADASAQSASRSAENAHDSAVDAQNYAESASGYASDAQGYANTASQKATVAGNSADQAAQIKTDIEGYVSTAQGYAQTATDKAAQASQSATNASNSATTASTKAGEASASATTASTKASEASGYASTASQKATEASQSASQTSGYAQTAESAKTDAQTAQGLAESARDTAVSAKTDAESAKADAESARDEAVQAVASISGALDDKAPVITDTASGAIASFSDGADDLPLKSLVVDINPIQDLHGQDTPYPAGGSANIWGIMYPVSTERGATVVERADGTFFVSCDVALGKLNYLLNVEANEAYTIKCELSDVTGNATQASIITVYDGEDETATILLNGVSSSASLKNFTPSGDKVYLKFNVTGGNAGGTAVIGKPTVIKGSYNTIPPYYPYENICPISGWTEVGVEQRGRNLWDEEWEVGGIDANTGENIASTTEVRSKNYISINSNATYFFYIGANYDTNVKIRTYDKNKHYIGYTAAFKNTVLSVDSNVCFIRFVMQYQYGTTYNHDISINYPSTDHSYHPYTGRSITIDLGQTVYGGKLDVLSGELVVDMVFATKKWGQMSSVYSGTTHSTKSLNFDADVLKGGQNSITNITATYIEQTTMQSTHYYIGSNFKTVYVVLPNDTDTDTDIQVCGTLAEPITIQLTPNQVNSLLGVNNIWADSGDTTAEYRADTKLFIERLTAPDSADMIADSNITSGQYFMVGNSLYKATANIANGASIIVGTNCIRKSLSEALNEINA